MYVNHITYIYCFVCEGLSPQSGEAVVIVAFGAHFFKDVARTQLESAAKSLLTPAERKRLVKAEKSKFVLPLAKAFLERGIVKVDKGCKLSKLSRNNLQKVGTF